MDIGPYLSGYADGEGCFTISFSKREKLLVGWEVRPSFSVSQKSDRAEVLFLFKEVFGCGFVRKSESDGTLKYEVRSIKDLIEKVIPHFEKYPLLSSKKDDFELFVRVCKAISNGEHLTIYGLRDIVEIAYQMNSSGIRRYEKESILSSLAKMKV